MAEISKYFQGERAECLIAIIIGITSIAVALLFLIQIKRPLYNGIAYSFLLMASIEIIVCTSAFIANPGRMKRAQEMVQTDTSKIGTLELLRMEAVMKSFILFRWVEIGLLLTGIALLITMTPASLWKGIGIGLIIQATQLLVLDYYDERRASVYHDFLRQL
jgi:hypothetical protein